MPTFSMTLMILYMSVIVDLRWLYCHSKCYIDWILGLNLNGGAEIVHITQRADKK